MKVHLKENKECGTSIEKGREETDGNGGQLQNLQAN